jgi:hypothetical protein
MSDEEPASSRKFLERPTAVVTLIGGVLAIVTGTVTLLGVFDGDNGENGGGTEQEKIDACVSQHGLSSSAEKTQISEGRLVFRGCTWPPPPGAENDGFTEITVASSEGPGASEAEGLTIADVFTTACRDIEVRYLFDDMGTFVPEQPIHLTKGEIRRVEGGSVWTPRNEQEALIYSPGRDESIVLSAARYKLDTARCIG